MHTAEVYITLTNSHAALGVASGFYRIEHDVIRLQHILRLKAKD